jgi:hypothetical protein
MLHEKIIKDSRGQIRIVINLWTDSMFGTDRSGNKFRYDVQRVMHKAPNKRTEVSNDSIVTDAEILEAKMELYNLIKPF